MSIRDDGLAIILLSVSTGTRGSRGSRGQPRTERDLFTSLLSLFLSTAERALSQQIVPKKTADATRLKGNKEPPSTPKDLCLLSKKSLPCLFLQKAIELSD